MATSTAAQYQQSICAGAALCNRALLIMNEHERNITHLAPEYTKIKFHDRMNQTFKRENHNSELLIQFPAHLPLPNA